jgi:hypothetical protein
MLKKEKLYSTILNKFKYEISYKYTSYLNNYFKYKKTRIKFMKPVPHIFRTRKRIAKRKKFFRLRWSLKKRYFLEQHYKFNYSIKKDFFFAKLFSFSYFFLKKFSFLKVINNNEIILNKLYSLWFLNNNYSEWKKILFRFKNSRLTKFYKQSRYLYHPVPKWMSRYKLKYTFWLQSKIGFPAIKNYWTIHNTIKKKKPFIVLKEIKHIFNENFLIHKRINSYFSTAFYTLKHYYSKLFSYFQFSKMAIGSLNRRSVIVRGSKTLHPNKKWNKVYMYLRRRFVKKNRYNRIMTFRMRFKFITRIKYKKHFIDYKRIRFFFFNFYMYKFQYRFKYNFILFNFKLKNILSLKIMSIYTFKSLIKNVILDFESYKLYLIHFFIKRGLRLNYNREKFSLIQKDTLKNKINVFILNIFKSFINNKFFFQKSYGLLNFLNKMRIDTLKNLNNKLMYYNTKNKNYRLNKKKEGQEPSNINKKKMEEEKVWNILFSMPSSNKQDKQAHLAQNYIATPRNKRKIFNPFILSKKVKSKNSSKEQELRKKWKKRKMRKKFKYIYSGSASKYYINNHLNLFSNFFTLNNLIKKLNYLNSFSYKASVNLFKRLPWKRVRRIHHKILKYNKKWDIQKYRGFHDFYCLKHYKFWDKKRRKVTSKSRKIKFWNKFHLMIRFSKNIYSHLKRKRVSFYPKNKIFDKTNFISKWIDKYISKYSYLYKLQKNLISKFNKFIYIINKGYFFKKKNNFFLKNLNFFFFKYNIFFFEIKNLNFLKIIYINYSRDKKTLNVYKKISDYTHIKSSKFIWFLSKLTKNESFNLLNKIWNYNYIIYKQLFYIKQIKKKIFNLKFKNKILYLEWILYLKFQKFKLRKLYNRFSLYRVQSITKIMNLKKRKFLKLSQDIKINSSGSKKYYNLIFKSRYRNPGLLFYKHLLNIKLFNFKWVLIFEMSIKYRLFYYLNNKFNISKNLCLSVLEKNQNNLYSLLFYKLSHIINYKNYNNFHYKIKYNICYKFKSKNKKKSFYLKNHLSFKIVLKYLYKFKLYIYVLYKVILYLIDFNEIFELINFIMNYLFFFYYKLLFLMNNIIYLKYLNYLFNFNMYTYNFKFNFLIKFNFILNKLNTEKSIQFGFNYYKNIKLNFFINKLFNFVIKKTRDRTIKLNHLVFQSRKLRYKNKIKFFKYSLHLLIYNLENIIKNFSNNHIYLLPYFHIGNNLLIKNATLISKFIGYKLNQGNFIGEIFGIIRRSWNFNYRKDLFKLNYVINRQNIIDKDTAFFLKNYLPSKNNNYKKFNSSYIKKEIKLIKGLWILISGRLRRGNMRKCYKLLNKGPISRKTFLSKIDYNNNNIATKLSSFGIKVWLGYKKINLYIKKNKILSLNRLLTKSRFKKKIKKTKWYMLLHKKYFFKSNTFIKNKKNLILQKHIT